MRYGSVESPHLRHLISGSAPWLAGFARRGADDEEGSVFVARDPFTLHARADTGKHSGLQPPLLLPRTQRRATFDWTCLGAGERTLRVRCEPDGPGGRVEFTFSQHQGAAVNPLALPIAAFTPFVSRILLTCAFCFGFSCRM